METINKAITHVGDLFRSMTPGARITAGLLFVAVVVSLAYLFAGGGMESEDYLFGGVPLPADEVRRIEAALLSSEISVDISGNRVRVPAGRRSEAMAAILAADAMPLNFHEIMTKALDSGSIFEGSAKFKERVAAAREQMLAMRINQFPWVEMATVSYDERKGPGLSRKPIMTAAVTIVPTAGETVDPIRQEKIQQIVAGSIAGITPDQVAVIDVGGERSSESGSLELAAFTNNPYLRDKFTYEYEMREKILDHLSYIPGVRVAVHAKLQRQLSSQTLTHKPDPKGTSQYAESVIETTTNASTTPGGRVGVVANGPGDPQQVQPTPTTQSQTSLEREKLNNIVGYTRQTTEEAGLVPEDVKATIEIPYDYIVNTVWRHKWRLQNPGVSESEMPMPTDDELQRLVEQKRTQIQTDIQNILPNIDAGEDPYPRVQVSFHETPEVELLEEPRLAQTAMWWLATHWATIGMFVVALFSLWMLRSMVKASSDSGRSASPARPALHLDVPTDVDEEEETEDDEESRPRLRIKKGPTLKDDLAQLVREDPDTAATILRSWIGRAA